MSDGGVNPYRESKLYQLCGDEFIAKAFRFAREADPKAILFYNDYNECDRRKSRNIYEMVLRMRAEGVPIDGIGMQGHYNIFGPSVQELDDALALYTPLVEHIHITELDVRASEEMGGQLRFDREGIAMSDTIQALHTQQYERLFQTFLGWSDRIDCVTFWNLHDGCSWLGEKNRLRLSESEEPSPPLRQRPPAQACLLSNHGKGVSSGQRKEQLRQHRSSNRYTSLYNKVHLLCRSRFFLLVSAKTF